MFPNLSFIEVARRRLKRGACFFVESISFGGAHNLYLKVNSLYSEVTTFSS
ncbi:hypothetical protein C4J98_0375 [Pseudomonas orientalis]|nr:hypothetical protein C4J98_0375 [Pseudomonas orientalis]